MKKIILLVCLVALFPNVLASAKKSQSAETQKPRQRKDGGPTYDDATIGSAVEAKIASMPSLQNAGIKATSKDGEVTLTGEVANYPQKGVATRAAKNVAGVKAVNNQITVAAGAAKPGKSRGGKAGKAAEPEPRKMKADAKGAAPDKM